MDKAALLIMNKHNVGETRYLFADGAWNGYNADILDNSPWGEAGKAMIQIQVLLTRFKRATSYSVSSYC